MLNQILMSFSLVKIELMNVNCFLSDTFFYHLWVIKIMNKINKKLLLPITSF